MDLINCEDSLNFMGKFLLVQEIFDGETKVGPTSGTQCVQLQAQHDDPLKLKFDENS